MGSIILRAKKGKPFSTSGKTEKKPPYRRRQTECKVSFKVQRVKGAFLRNVGNQKEMAVFRRGVKKPAKKECIPLEGGGGESALTAGSGCVVPRPSRVEVVPISTPAFGRGGALDCAWEANTRLSLPVRSSWCICGNPAFSCGLASSLRVRGTCARAYVLVDGGDFLGRAVGGDNMRYYPRPPAPRCAPATVFQVNGNKVIKVIASVPCI